MKKCQSNNEMFTHRSGSFSTHGSRKGVNLLGWGEKEILTPTQQREALIVALRDIAEAISATKLVLKERLPFKQADALAKKLDEYRSRYHEITAELTEINKVIKAQPNDDIGDYLVRMFKRRVTKHEWTCILAEAKRLKDAGVPVDDI